MDQERELNDKSNVHQLCMHFQLEMMPQMGHMKWMFLWARFPHVFWSAGPLSPFKAR